ncbi:MAG TPA: hypothetical protein VEL74_08010 [Thermoanaerobaculia bacterium]|nr:hypothetical protein [Thermoanaerobaculia bacterium]
MVLRKSSTTALATALTVCLLAGAAGAQDTGLVEGVPAPTLEQAIPLFAWSPQGRSPALLFARFGTAERPAAGVMTSTRDGWRLVQLPDSIYYTVWSYVGRSSGEQIWGISQPAGPQPATLEFSASSNGGRGWTHRSSLRKVSPYAVVDAFGMDAEGHGSVVLRLDEDPTPNAPRLGFYMYLTKNGAKSWSEPIYSFERPRLSGDMPAAPDRSFAYDAPPGVDAWRGILTSLAPSG